jgi:hypothetical protein
MFSQKSEAFPFFLKNKAQSIKNKVGTKRAANAALFVPTLFFMLYALYTIVDDPSAY